jgi:SAM-dependent methyltransferase
MEVADFYNRLPYPLKPRPTTWAEPLRAFCKSDPARILHAGCATGSQTRALAYAFPNAEIVGVDFADSSLAIARRYLSDPKMRKVAFEKADLTEPLEPRFGTFDLVLSYGVLHHIPDVDRAVENVAATLRTADSPFIVFLYGKYGRSRIAQLQQALARWQSAVPDVDPAARIEALWRTARSNGTFRGPRGWLKLALVRFSRGWRDVWVSSNADAYLHPFVRYYDLEDIFALLERHGLRFGEFVRRDATAKAVYPADEAGVLDRFGIKNWNRIPERDRMAIVDRLSAPHEYEFVCYRRPAAVS